MKNTWEHVVVYHDRRQGCSCLCININWPTFSRPLSYFSDFCVPFYESTHWFNLIKQWRSYLHGCFFIYTYKFIWKYVKMRKVFIWKNKMCSRGFVKINKLHHVLMFPSTICSLQHQSSILHISIYLVIRPIYVTQT